MSAPTGKVCWTTPCTSATGTPEFAGSGTTPSSTPTSKPRPSCFPTRCCCGKTLQRAMDGASWIPTATAAAPSMTIYRAPVRLRWQRRSPRFASAECRCAISELSYLEPVRQVLESPTRFAMPWCVRVYPKKMRRAASGAWTGRDYSPGARMLVFPFFTADEWFVAFQIHGVQSHFTDSYKAPMTWSTSAWWVKSTSMHLMLVTQRTIYYGWVRKRKKYARDSKNTVATTEIRLTNIERIEMIVASLQK